MLLRKTVHKTIQNFKSFILKGYKKLTRPPSLKLFSTNYLNNPKIQQLDSFYKDFCDNINQNSEVPEKEHTEQQDLKSLKPVVISIHEEQKDVGCSKHVNVKTPSHVLEQKMKELEMMDMKDEEHVLDIEEVLHYYSLLKSPIYQDLVDKFFTDMYSEFNVPQPPIRSNSMNSSIRRLGPLNI